MRHYAVVRRYNQYGYVGDLGAAGTDGGESLVARGVQEGYLLALAFHLVRPDVLGDAADFTFRNVRMPDGVQESGFTVVHVP